jgi:hypothetical protein
VSVKPIASDSPPLGRHVLFRPRAAIGRLVAEGRQGKPILLSVAAGIVQALVSIATHQVGPRWPEIAVLPIAVAAGALWGLLQVSVLAGSLSLTSRSGGSTAQFRDRCIALGWANLPMTGALVAWVIGILAIGRPLYLDPEFAAIASPASGAIVGLVALATVIGWLWSAVVVGAVTLQVGPSKGGARAGRLVLVLALLVAAAITFFSTLPLLFR